uniref:Uncharacterized protein n=1 Tax=Arundo donax TaxID=35708 RepID=A0A0A8ZIA8_ARUDO
MAYLAISYTHNVILEWSYCRFRFVHISFTIDGGFNSSLHSGIKVE